MLILRNLPPNVSRRDLKSFVVTELHRAGIRGNPLLQLCSNCSILRIADPARGTTKYHGLVEVQPARIAMQAIALLNGKCIDGAPIEVRRYRQRTLLSERMDSASLQGGGIAAAPPRRERRCVDIKIDLVDSTPPMACLMPA